MSDATPEERAPGLTLKPCPFCGGEAEIERVGSRRASCIVACTNCGARHESPDEGEQSGASWNLRDAATTLLRRERDDALASACAWKRVADEADPEAQQKRAAIVEWLENHQDKMVRDLSDLNGRMEGEIDTLRRDLAEALRDAAKYDEADRERIALRRTVARLEQTIGDDYREASASLHHMMRERDAKWAERDEARRDLATLQTAAEQVLALRLPGQLLEVRRLLGNALEAIRRSAPDPAGS